VAHQAQSQPSPPHKERKQMTEFNIPAEVKTQILTERIQQLSIEGYQHELNRATAEALGNTEQVTQADEAITIIKAAIAVAESQL
jgi:hypothetical protein